METSEPPFSDLGPDTVLDAVESLGFACDGRVLSLNSYENRVLRIGIEDAAPLVAKFYRPGRWSDEAILEEHAFADELVAAELPVVAPLRVDGRSLHHVDGHRVALFPLRGGHAPEADDRPTLEYLGRMLARLHAVGETREFQHRSRLDVELFGHDPVDFLLEAQWLPAHLEQSFERLADALLDAIEDRFDRAGEVRWLRVHGDCHAGNLLWRDDAVHIVDLDDTLMAPAMQDLWMFLSGSHDDQRRQFGWLLDGYRMFRAFDPRELQLIEALRGLRLLHYHAWIARRWDDPAFPAAFPWFGEPRHWEGVITQIQEQLAAMDEPVIGIERARA